MLDDLPERCNCGWNQILAVLNFFAAGYVGGMVDILDLLQVTTFVSQHRLRIVVHPDNLHVIYFFFESSLEA